jgi:RND family efflux transporter MFP subunit
MRSKWLLGASLLAGLIGAPGAAVTSGELNSATVQTVGGGELDGYDGVVEAVRQTVVAAQVSGAVVALEAKVGDVVRAGQVLARIDAHAAEQSVAASDAQVRSAHASLDVATRAFERQKQLFEQKFTSQAALEQAEAQFKATRAQVEAQIAQAGLARVQSGFYVVKAPYAGVVAEVPVMLGDMAMPGRPLLTLYDPAALRVTVAVPQTAVAVLPAAPAIRIELSGGAGDRQRVAPTRIELLPTADPGTHTVQIRLDLPPTVRGVKPGSYARAWLPGQADVTQRIYVPTTAIVRRAEMTGVYAIDPTGRPVLRQVRLGRVADGTVEILAGLSAGERVALDPQAAARIR